MRKDQLLKALEGLPDDTEICVYEDSAYWNVKEIRQVLPVSDFTERTAVPDSIPQTAIVLTGYSND